MAPIIATDAATNGIAKQKPKKDQPSCAYVTFLAGNGDYVKGVVGLAKGLRKAESKFPLMVAILPDVPADHRKILVDQGCIMREIKPVYQPENQTQFAMAYYVINYSKLRIWKFVEYNIEDLSFFTIRDNTTEGLYFLSFPYKMNKNSKLLRSCPPLGLLSPPPRYTLLLHLLNRKTSTCPKRKLIKEIPPITPIFVNLDPIPKRNLSFTSIK